MNEDVREQALGVFALLKDECTAPELMNWLEDIAEASLAHMTVMETCEEDQISDEDRALLTIMEPFLFLLGVALQNSWVERLEGEQ